MKHNPSEDQILRKSKNRTSNSEAIQHPIQFHIFSSMTSSFPIVFYDGDCGFCNRSVAFILKNDKTKSLHFAALQSDFTLNLFKEKGWAEPDLSTFYLYKDGSLYERSSAALKVAAYFKFPQSALQFFWIVPRPVRDYVYNGIAKRRQRLAKGFCVLPSPEDRKRFLS